MSQIVDGIYRLKKQGADQNATRFFAVISGEGTIEAFALDKGLNPLGRKLNLNPVELAAGFEHLGRLQPYFAKVRAALIGGGTEAPVREGTGGKETRPWWELPGAGVGRLLDD